MRILITNDDSVSATQLLPLIRWCQKWGQVTVVVPKIEQSGKSHGIEIREPFMVHEMMLEDVPVYAVAAGMLLFFHFLGYQRFPPGFRLPQ